eukprot:scaffold264_cov317-Pinguiococcus_pyrenoidosus.AAC.25
MPGDAPTRASQSACSRVAWASAKALAFAPSHPHLREAVHHLIRRAAAPLVDPQRLVNQRFRSRMSGIQGPLQDVQVHGLILRQGRRRPQAEVDGAERFRRLPHQKVGRRGVSVHNVRIMQLRHDLAQLAGHGHLFLRRGRIVQILAKRHARDSLHVDLMRVAVDAKDARRVHAGLARAHEASHLVHHPLLGQALVQLWVSVALSKALFHHRRASEELACAHALGTCQNRLGCRGHRTR